MLHTLTHHVCATIWSTFSYLIQDMCMSKPRQLCKRLVRFGVVWYMWVLGSCERENHIVTSIPLMELCKIYHEIFNTKRTTSQNLNVSRLALQMSFPNPLKQGAKSIKKMLLEQRRQAMLQLHLNNKQFLFPTMVRLILYIWRFILYIWR